MQILNLKFIQLLIYILPLFYMANYASAIEKSHAHTCLKSIVNSADNARNFTSKSSDLKDVKIEYVTHSTFKITSPKGIIIEVDFAGLASKTGNGRAPDIITLNHTALNDLPHKPATNTKIILAPWSEKTNTAQQHVIIKDDVSIKNFNTDIYENGVMKIPKGNSIFVFKIAGLCIAHLGNIHHMPSKEQLGSIGNIDIALVPVDGRDNFTYDPLIELLTELQVSVVIPMHWNNNTSEQNFMGDISPYFSIAGYPTNLLSVTTKTLPKSPTIVTMIPQHDQNDFKYFKHK